MGDYACRRAGAGYAWLRSDIERVTPGSGLAQSEVSPARRWGVSDCPSGRTRQGADARPLTIPASGCLRATLRAVPSSFTAADGPSGLAVPGEAVLSPTSCRLFLAFAHSSALRTPLANPRLQILKCYVARYCLAAHEYECVWQTPVRNS